MMVVHGSKVYKYLCTDLSMELRRRLKAPALEGSFGHVALRRAVDESIGLKPKFPLRYLSELFDERTSLRRLGQMIGRHWIELKGAEANIIEVSISVSQTIFKVLKQRASDLHVEILESKEIKNGEAYKLRLKGTCTDILGSLQKVPYSYIHYDAVMKRCLESISDTSKIYDYDEIEWRVTHEGLRILSKLFDYEFIEWEDFRRYVADKIKYARYGLVTLIETLERGLMESIESLKLRSREDALATTAVFDALRERLAVPSVVLAMDEDPVLEELKEISVNNKSLLELINAYIAPPLISAGREFFLRAILWRHATENPISLETLKRYIPLNSLKGNDLLRRLKALERAGEIRILDKYGSPEVEIIAQKPPEIIIYGDSPLAVERAVGARLYAALAARTLGFTRLKFQKDVGGGLVGSLSLFYDTVAHIPAPFALIAETNFDNWHSHLNDLAERAKRISENLGIIRLAEQNIDRIKAVHVMMNKLKTVIEKATEAGMLIHERVREKKGMELGQDELIVSRSFVPRALAERQEESLAKELISALMHLKYNRGVEIKRDELKKALESLGIDVEVIADLQRLNLITPVSSDEYLVAADYKTTLVDYLSEGLGLPTTLRIAHVLGFVIDKYRNNRDFREDVIKLMENLVNQKEYAIREANELITLWPVIQILKAEGLVRTDPTNFNDFIISHELIVKPNVSNIKNYGEVIQTLWHSIALGLGYDVKSDFDYMNDKLARELINKSSDHVRKLIFS